MLNQKQRNPLKDSSEIRFILRADLSSNGYTGTK